MCKPDEAILQLEHAVLSFKGLTAILDMLPHTASIQDAGAAAWLIGKLTDELAAAFDAVFKEHCELWRAVGASEEINDLDDVIRHCELNGRVTERQA